MPWWFARRSGNYRKGAYHRIRLCLYWLWRISPPQARQYRCNVYLLSRATKTQYNASRTAYNHSFGCHLSCVTPVNDLQSRYASLASPMPTTARNAPPMSSNSCGGNFLPKITLLMKLLANISPSCSRIASISDNEVIPSPLTLGVVASFSRV